MAFVRGQAVPSLAAAMVMALIQSAGVSADDGSATVGVIDDRYESEPYILEQEPRDLARRAQRMTCVAYSPDNRFLATGSGWHSNSAGELVLWDLATKKMIWERAYSFGIRQIAFTPDGTQLVAVHPQGAELIDAFAGTLIREFKGHAKNLDDVDISQDGKLLVTCDNAHEATTAIVWELATGRRVQTYRGHASDIYSVSFSPDGKQVLSAGRDRSVRIWDVATGKDRKVWADESQIYVSHAKFSHDGRRAAWSPYREPCKVWDAETDKILELEGHQSGLAFISFSPNDKYVVTSTRKPAEVFLWDAVTGKQIGQLHHMKANQDANVVATAQPPHEDAVFTCAFSPDSKHIATASWDRTVKIWDVATRKLLHTITYTKADPGEPVELLAACYSRDGKLVATGDINGHVKIREVRTGNLLHTVKAHEDAITKIGFSPNGKRFVSASYDGKMKIWNVETAKLLHTVGDGERAVLAFAFAADGKHLYSAGDGRKVQRWSVSPDADGKLELVGQVEAHPASIQALDVAQDESFVVTGSADTTLRIWDLPELTLRAECQGHDGAIWALAVAPNAKRVISVGDDKVLQSWDATTGKLVWASRAAHRDTITCIAFSHSGKVAATGSLDKTICVWSAATGAQTDFIRAHRSGVTAMMFSPDDRYLASASEDKTFKLWSAAKVLKPTKPVRQLDASIHTEVAKVHVTADQKELHVISRNAPFIRAFDFATGLPLREVFNNTKGNQIAGDFTPDGRWVAVSNEGSGITIFDTRTSARVMHVSLASVITSVAFSPDGKRLAATSNDRSLRVYRVPAGTLVASGKHPRYQLRDVAWMPAGDRVVTAAWNEKQYAQPGAVTIWDGDTATMVHNEEGPSLRATAVAVSPNGQQIAMAELSRKLLVFDAELNPLGTCTLKGEGGSTQRVHFLPDSRRLAVGTSRGSLALFDTKTFAEIGRFESFTHVLPNSIWANIWSITSTPDQKFLVVGGRGYDHRQVRIYPVAHDAKLNWPQPRIIEPLHTLQADEQAVIVAQFSPSSPIVAIGGSGKEITIWNAVTNQIVQRLAGHQSGVPSLVFLADGKTLVSGGYDKTVRVWDIAAGDSSKVMHTFDAYPRTLQASPDGKTLIVGTRDGGLSAWDPVHLRMRYELPQQRGVPMAIAFSHQGHEFCTATEVVGEKKQAGEAHRWETETGRDLASIDLHHQTRPALAYASNDTGLLGRMYNEVRERKHADGSLAAAYWTARNTCAIELSHHGKWFVTGHGKGEVRVWSTARREELARLIGHTLIIEDLSISHDDNYIVAAAKDGTVRVWDVSELNK